MFEDISIIDSVNWDTGIIYFNTELTDSLIIKYIPLQSFSSINYFLYEPTEDTVFETSGDISVESYQVLDEIYINGEQAFGMNWDQTGKADIEQEILLNFYGHIAGNWGFQGSIKGGRDDIPIPLTELDRMYLQLYSDFVKASVGDIQLEEKMNEAGDFKQDILGVDLEVNIDSFLFKGSYGENKSENITVILDVHFGYQGPYKLLHDYERFSIIPGSESVYLNGKLLEEEDYSLITSEGFLTFSPDISLEDDDKVIVYFKVSGIDYRRYTRRTGLFWSNNFFGFRFSDFGLKDVKDAPLNFSLNETTMEILQQIGDSTGNAWVDGGQFVGEDRGYYDKVDSIYIYRGYNGGNYNVKFSRIDSTQGNYVYDYSIAGYRFVGEGLGNYIAAVSVTPPVAKQADLIEIYFDRFDLSMIVNLLRTNSDLNLFSSVDDFNNIGYAGDVFVTFEKKFLHLNLQTGATDNNFRSLTSNGYGLFLEEFSSYVKDDCKYGIFNIAFFPFDFLYLRGDLQKLDNPDDDKINISSYFEIKISKLTTNIGFQFFSTDSVIQTDSAFSKEESNYSASLLYSFGFIEPFISFKFTEKSDSFDFKIYRTYARLPVFFKNNSSFSIFGNYEKQNIDLQEDWQNYLTSSEIGFQYSYLTRKRNISLYISKKIYNPASVNPMLYQSFYLGKFKANILRNGYSFFNTEYELNRELHIYRRPIYIEVREGEGDFGYDSLTSSYYPDIHGNYIRRWEQAGDGEPVTTVKFNLSFYPKISNFGLDFLLGAEEVSRSKNIFSLMYFSPEISFNKENTINAQRLLKLRLFYRNDLMKLYSGFNWDKKLSTDIDQNRYRRKYRIYTGFENEEENHFDIKFHYENINTQQVSTEEGASQENYSLFLLYGRKIGSFEPFISAKYEIDFYDNYIGYQFSDPFNQKALDISPGIIYESKLRLNINFGLTFVEYSIEDIPAELKANSCPGYNYHWMIRSSYYLNNNVNFMFSYIGEKNPDRKAYQELSTGVRILF